MSNEEYTAEDFSPVTLPDGEEIMVSDDGEYIWNTETGDLISVSNYAEHTAQATQAGPEELDAWRDSLEPERAVELAYEWLSGIEGMQEHLTGANSPPEPPATVGEAVDALVDDINAKKE